MAELARLPQSAAPVPPQNLEAEESVLGAMMLSPGAIGAVSEVLDGGDFYRESHAKIFRAALALYAKGEPVDAITLVDELEERGELEGVGGKARIHELAALVPAASNAGHYARIIRDTATLRELIRAGSEIQRLGQEREGELDDILATAEQLLFEAVASRAGSDAVPIKEALLEAFGRINALYETGGEISGVETGFKDLDKITAGFQPGNLVILAARPSVGKSAFALGMMTHVAAKGTGCAFFALEMSRGEIAQRLMCSESKVDSHKVRTGTLAQEDWPRLAAACASLEKLPLYIDDTPALTLLELRSKLQTLVRRDPSVGCVVVDYLQLMSAGSHVESRLQEVSALSRGLKAIARDFNLPVIALSQLSRAVEQRHDKRPMLSDLRESGTIEQDADLVMFLYRSPEGEEAGYVDLDVAKHRNGPTDSLKLTFLKRYAKFANHH
jgi:replicative DNA helicase